MTETKSQAPAADTRREPLIRVENVGMDFSGRTVLDSVSMDVYHGETLVVMGGSG